MPSSAYTSPIQAVRGVLANFGNIGVVPGITWGSGASPYLEQVPEPPPDPTATPFVVFTIASKSLEHAIGFVDFFEVFTVEFAVYAGQADIDAISTPYDVTGLFYQLDQLILQPGVFNGGKFTCDGWYRNAGWTIKMEAFRAPDVQRVWCSRSSYEMTINRVN